jgi:hypothetical protein
MPEQEVIDRAKRDKEEGKSPSTQASEFVREEMRHIREGKHGAANTKTGHRHRTFQGPTRRRRTAAAERRQYIGAHPQTGATRQSKRHARKSTSYVQNAFARGVQRAET